MSGGNVMVGHTASRRAGALQLLGALSLLFLTFATRAMTISPSPSYDGNYTVSWGTTLGCTYNDDPPFYSYQCYSLLENGVETGASGYSASVTGKPEGTYEYSVYYTFYVYGQPYDAYPVEGASVTVGTPPPRDSLSTQLNYQFQTRQGDINYDGLTDLFVQRSSGGVSGNGVLDSVLLQQNASGGTFSPVVLDPYYSSIASGWPVSSATPVITDFNVDGYVDVEVKGVAAATGTSADDQIVYSSGVPLQPQPLGLRAVDLSLKEFVGNSLDYFVNPNYFTDNASVGYVYGYFVYFYCWPSLNGIMNDSYLGGWFCTVYYDYYYGYYWDYSGFSSEAVALWANEEGLSAGQIDESQSTEGAQEAAEEALEVEVGGWPMEEEFGTTGQHEDPNVRRGLEVFWAILGIGRANAQEVETDEAPAQVPREPGIIYLTAHKVAGIGGIKLSLHAAVEYTSPYTPYKTISAYNSNGSATYGTLISQKNWEFDMFGNMTKGTVIPSTTLSDAHWVYWVRLMEAEDNYSRQNQPYNADPSVFSGGGYNSNGFINGMLQATGGGSTPPVTQANGFRGANHPVPAFAFQ
jgi:hypothetical protein